MQTNLSEVMECLKDFRREIEWDDCWDTLKYLGPQDRDQRGLLFDGLLEESSLVRSYAMEGLRRTEVPVDRLVSQFNRAIDAACDNWHDFGSGMLRVMAKANRTDAWRMLMRRIAREPKFGLVNRLAAVALQQF